MGSSVTPVLYRGRLKVKQILFARDCQSAVQHSVHYWLIWPKDKIMFLYITQRNFVLSFIIFYEELKCIRHKYRRSL